MSEGGSGAVVPKEDYDRLKESYDRLKESYDQLKKEFDQLKDEPRGKIVGRMVLRSAICWGLHQANARGVGCLRSPCMSARAKIHSACPLCRRGCRPAVVRLDAHNR